MTLESKVFGIIFLIMFLDMFLLLAFASITVRKLKKNPATKDFLGFEIYSGFNIFGIAQALSWPRTITKKTDSSKFSFIVANAELLHKHTNKFDKILARSFYWPMIFSVISLLLFGALSELGVFVVSK